MKKQKVLLVGWGTETAQYVLAECIKLKNYDFYLATTLEILPEIRKLFDKDRIIITNPYNEIVLCEDIGRYCLNNKIKFDIVTSFFEMCVYQTAFLAEYLGINNCLPVKNALRSSVNKYLMRLNLQKYEIRQPTFFKFSEDSISEGFNFFKKNLKKAIIKPIHSGHSYGVRFLEEKINFNRFKECVDEAISDYSKNYDEWMRYEDIDNLEFLIEEFIEGKIFSFDGFARKNGKFEFIGTTEFELSEPPVMQQIGHTSPIYSLTEEQLNNGKKYVKKVVKALGLQYCGFHCELKFIKNNPYLIEISGRIPGAMISRTYQNLSEYNLFDRFFSIFDGRKKFVKNKEFFKSESMKIIFNDRELGVVKSFIKDKVVVNNDFFVEIRARKDGEMLFKKNNPFGVWLYDINIKSKKLSSKDLIIKRDSLIDKQEIKVDKNLYFYMNYFLNKFKKFLKYV
jgi:hypothetical protein